MSVSTAASAPMAYLSNFAKSAGLVSPANQHRDGSSLRSTTISNPMRQLDRASMSPTKRTTKWLEGHPSAKGIALHNVIRANVAKPSHDNRQKRRSLWGLSNLASFFSKGKATDCDNLEGDTIINSDDPTPTTEHDNDSTIVVDEEEEEVVKVQKTERTLQDYRTGGCLSYNDSRIQNWTADEIWFVNKLRTRSSKPLFETTWLMDFPQFPLWLFTRDPNQIFINNTNGTIFRAANALQKLINAGPLVRGQLTNGAIPEKPLLREITNYYKWTLVDGNLEHKAHIPVTAIACAKPKESTESVVSRVTDQLHSLARQYRDKWRHPKCKESDKKQVYTHPLPTLFGFVIKYTVVAVVTCDSSVPGKPIRTLHTGDWTRIGQDVWHAISVSIAFVKQRNYLMQLDKEGELGPKIIEEESDPDA